MKTVWMIFAPLVLAAGGASVPAEDPAASRKQNHRDRLHAAVQEICPVSGQKLGAHGTPIKVKVGKEEIFLCCRECAKKQIHRQHWATIHTNFAAAQRICPVMKQELPDRPKWTIVKGQIVYICCPPCTAKIEADPETWLQKVDQLYLTSLQAKAKRQ